AYKCEEIRNTITCKIAYSKAVTRFRVFDPLLPEYLLILSIDSKNRAAMRNSHNVQVAVPRNVGQNGRRNKAMPLFGSNHPGSGQFLLNQIRKFGHVQMPIDCFTSGSKND